MSHSRVTGSTCMFFGNVFNFGGYTYLIIIRCSITLLHPAAKHRHNPIATHEMAILTQFLDRNPTNDDNAFIEPPWFDSLYRIAKGNPQFPRNAKFYFASGVPILGKCDFFIQPRVPPDFPDFYQPQGTPTQPKPKTDPPSPKPPG